MTLRRKEGSCISKSTRSLNNEVAFPILFFRDGQNSYEYESNYKHKTTSTNAFMQSSKMHLYSKEKYNQIHFIILEYISGHIGCTSFDICDKNLVQLKERTAATE